jgi:hypothetical protein
LVPIPRAADLGVLNALLLVWCREDECRQIAGRDQTVGAAMALERDHLLPLAAEGFRLEEISFPTADRSGCVLVKTNAYSVPARPGTRVQVKLYPAHLEIWNNGGCIARHERCYARRQQILDLEHYLEVLDHKPGALAGSKPLEQWRRAGRWPASFDALWQRLNDRHGRPHGTRLMIGVLRLGQQVGHDRLRHAVETALELGCWDAEAVRYLLTSEQLVRPAAEAADIGVLACYDRPMPSVSGYDQLLGQETPR